MKRINRRAFIKGSVAAAAVALPASSWARVRGSNGDIRVAVAGLGGKGCQHIRIFRQLKGVRVVALCEVDGRRLGGEVNRFKARREKVDAYVDYRKLLDDKSIDAVVTATPNHWHALVTVWACQAGKHVYVEKPVSHNIWEGQRMIQAARKHGRMVQSGTQLRSDLGLREAFAYIKEGHIGKVRLVRGLCYERRSSIGKVNGPTAAPGHVNYDLWCGPAPKKPLMRRRLHYDWHWIWDTGNGDLGNQGIHQMDVCRRVMGADTLAPRVISVGGRFAWNDDGETPNTQLIFYDYAPVPILFEVRGMPLKAGRRAWPHYRGIRCGNVIHCEGGYFACGESGGGMVYDNDGKRVKSFAGRGAGDHQANFIKAVRSGKREDLNGDILEGHLSSALCHVGSISHRIGAETPPGEIGDEIKANSGMTDAFERMKEHLVANGVDLLKTRATLGPALTMDVRKERFTGPHSASANALGTRTYRKPFVVPGGEA